MSVSSTYVGPARSEWWSVFGGLLDWCRLFWAFYVGVGFCLFARCRHLVDYSPSGFTCLVPPVARWFTWFRTLCRNIMFLAIRGFPPSTMYLVCRDTVVLAALVWAVRFLPISFLSIRAV